VIFKSIYFVSFYRDFSPPKVIENELKSLTTMTSSLHVKTPLIFSQRLTKIFGKGPVYLKLENLQVLGLIFS